ncbi:hypothetical protein [Methanobrevibacter sp.]|uniref:hypothetical protein n=1 Tax=Methanobrevibacter sp. TaxID=66852 RepID=UPI003867CAEE
MSFTILVLNPKEEPLEYLDSEQCEIEEVSEEKELRRLTLIYPLGDNINHTRELFKIGNKVWVPGGNGLEPCLYIISSANKFDFWQDNNIELELEEVLVELNYVELFEQRSDENITIDSNFLQEEFGNYFIIDPNKVEGCLTDRLQKVALNGTMTKLELLRYIEEETSNIFVTRYEKDETTNVIHRYLDFKNPNNVGRELNTVIDLSFNADNIEYTIDESDTFKAMAPILSLDSVSSGGENEMTRSDLQTIINNWKNLSISKGSLVPMIIEQKKYGSAKSGTSSQTNYFVLVSHENNEYTYNEATAYWNAPFEKRSGELFIRDSLDTEVSYDEIQSRKDLDSSVVVPKVGTLETSESDKYIIYNRCAMKLIEKRYSEINLEVDVKDIEQVTTNNSGFNLYDKVRIKIPEYEKAITAQVLAITKNPQLPGETKITFGNANVGTKINQEVTILTASNTTVKYKKGQSISATLTKSDGTVLSSENCSIYIHRDEKKITTKAYDEYVKVTTDVVTTVKGNTTTIKTYETIDGVKKLVKTVTKTVSANQIKTVTKEPGKKAVTKITTSDGTTVTKNKNDRDVSTNKAGKISKSTTSTMVGGGKSSNPADAPLLTVTGNAGIKTSAYPYKKSTQKYYTKTWRNWCPFCHRIGSLSVNPKGVADGELTCGNGKRNTSTGCGADFDIPTGLDKDPRRRAALRDANGKYNTKNNIKTSVGNATYTAKATNKDSTNTKTTKDTKKIHHKAVTTTIPAYDKVYNKKTNANGVVSLKINSLDKGVYKVTFNYGGSIGYGSSSKTITLTVN